MKTPSVVKSVQDAVAEAEDRTFEAQSRPGGADVLRMLAWIGTALVTMILGKLVQRCCRRMMGMRDERERLQHEDEKLDSALEDTMDASDAITKY